MSAIDDLKQGLADLATSAADDAAAEANNHDQTMAALAKIDELVATIAAGTGTDPAVVDAVNQVKALNDSIKANAQATKDNAQAIADKLASLSQAAPSP